MNVDSPLQAIAQLLIEQQPSSLLLCTRSSIPGVAEYTNEKQCATTKLKVGSELRELTTPERFDLAIVADQLEHLPKRAGTELLGRIRNLHSNHFCVVYAPAADHTIWTAVDFFSLGMKLAATFHNEGRELQCYTYAIENYNHKREWNNNRFWANPHNFDKYWW